MDTHIITDRPEIQLDDDGEGLPNLHTEGQSAFRPLDAKERLVPETAADGMRPKRRRNGLMITVCSVAVLAAAGGVFWISPYNHYSFAGVRRLATEARSPAVTNFGGVRAPTLLAPAAQLARAPAPIPVPQPYRTRPTTTLATSGGDDMTEFLKLGGQAPDTAPTPVAAALAMVPPKPATVAAVSRPVTPAADQTAHAPVDASHVAPSPIAPVLSTLVSAKPDLPPAKAPAPPPVASAAPAELPKPEAAAAAPPKDPVAAIAALRPAPMTDAQQLQVLDLVTQLGTLVRDQRLEIAELKSNQQNLTQRVDSALTDFGRRISLAEAHGAVSAAMGVTNHPADLPNAATADQNSSGGIMPIAARTTAPPQATTPASPASSSETHRYHVQAASPGLAMLAELDASGGEERQLPVAPGDTVPGWGKVISIAQGGSSWFVKTDHGLIQ